MTDDRTTDESSAPDGSTPPVTAPTGDPPSHHPDPAAATPADADTPTPEPAASQPAASQPAASQPPASQSPAGPGPADSGPADPGPAVSEAGGDPVEVAAEPEREAGVDPPVAPWRRLSSAGALIWVLIALFGFTLVVQLRSNDTEQGLSTMRQEDLVRILSDLEARETRLNSEISSLEESQRDLTSGVEGREAALAEADRRANELGLLAGTLPGRGPGLVIQVSPGGEPIKASAVLNTVQELRGAGGEAMQIAGGNGAVVRVVASTAFVDDGGQVAVDGVRLPAPYVITVIGAPQTMETALNIPGGVVASVGNAGGTVIAEQRKAVDVTAVRSASNLQYARPVS